MAQVKIYQGNFNGSSDFVEHAGATFTPTKAVNLYNFLIQLAKEEDTELSTCEAQEFVDGHYTKNSDTEYWAEEDQDGIVDVYYEWIEADAVEPLGFLKFDDSDVVYRKMEGHQFGYNNQEVHVWYVENDTGFYPLVIQQHNGDREVRAYLNDDCMTCHSTYVSGSYGSGSYNGHAVN